MGLDSLAGPGVWALRRGVSGARRLDVTAWESFGCQGRCRRPMMQCVRGE